MSTIFHVSPTGSDIADGTAEQPFRTIGRGAQAAWPGDTVRVHEGVYREWVAPVRGGLSDTRRLTFEAAPGEHVVIKGSERVRDWEHLDGDMWRTWVPNELFGDWNPFALTVHGDWLVRPHQPQLHLGDLYVDGAAAYEMVDPDAVGQPVRRTEVTDDWSGVSTGVEHPDLTRLQWHAEVGTRFTVITANLPGMDPHDQLVEISVRRSVFFPTEHHVDHVTVRGFEMCHAASPWAPPTGDQPGLIGPNWAKGWIIEDNHIHHAKCSAISLGKEASTGHNLATYRGDKPGYQYQLESVFSALRIGWDREHIGSHVVRGNRIHDCGQNGIVGHLGCAFSTIEDNDISRIGTRREFFGHEIGGIKLHAPIDVRIEHNRIHHCTLGLWLDWQTQGTRITRNVMHDNTRDLFIEVSHGPYVVDHNVLASAASIENRSQGGAFIANLVCGSVAVEGVEDRATPYHLPHSTQVAGYAVIHQGDDRYLGNLFIADPGVESFDPDLYHGRELPRLGLSIYDGHPTSFDEYLASVPVDPTQDHTRFAGVKQPVHIAGNVYGPGNAPFEREDGATVLTEAVHVSLREDGGHVLLDITLPEDAAQTRLGPVSGADLGHVRMAGLDFEEADGAPLRVITDLLGRPRDGESTAGPIGTLEAGTQTVRVW